MTDPATGNEVDGLLDFGPDQAHEQVRALANPPANGINGG